MKSLNDKLWIGGWALILNILLLLPQATAAELNFENVFESHSAVLLIVEPETGHILDANKAASQFYGYSRIELKQMNIQDVNTLTAEEVANERKLAKKEHRNFFIFRHRLKNGEIKTVEVHSNPYQYMGKTVLLSVIHDISKQRQMQDDLWHYQGRLEQMVDRQTAELKETHQLTVMILLIGIVLLLGLIAALVFAIRKLQEAKKVEQRERQMLDEIIWGTGVGTYEWNVQTGVMKTNKRFLEMVGYKREELEPVTIETWKNLTHPLDLEVALEIIEKTFSKEREFYESEFRMTHKDGSIVWVLSKGNVVEWSQEGKPLRMSGTHTNITSLKQTEVELEKAKKIAEEASLAKSEFLASMSHDLRAPMMGIRGVLGLLRDNKTVVKQESDLLDDLDDMSTRMMSLLDDILDLSKIEAGQLQLDVDAWEPAKIIENIVSLFRPTALKKDIEISTTASQYLGYWCKTDDIRLRQIVSNLVSNAVKYTKSGSVDVDVHIALGEENDRLVIEVKDTGVGISKEKLDGIFDRFTQPLQKGNTQGGRAGLGLAIAHELTEIMGGRLTAKSTPGQGSVFTLSLPVQWAERPVLEHKQDFVIAPLKILMFKANPVNQKVIASMLMRNGHSVSVAEDVEDMLAYAQAERFDVILLDSEMAEDGAFKVIGDIRQKQGPNKDKPIIAFAKLSPKQKWDELTEAGVTSIIAKPVKHERFFAELGRLFGDKKKS